MEWVLLVVFIAVGLTVIVMRRDLARGISLVMGGTLPVGCVVLLGVFFIVSAIAFITWHLSLAE